MGVGEVQFVTSSRVRQHSWLREALSVLQSVVEGVGSIIVETQVVSRPSRVMAMAWLLYPDKSSAVEKANLIRPDFQQGIP